ncbi:nitroreductase family protein [Kribbella sp.]|uniref:nitroreductase family protein n=1 Tax=Kribbella sp. TaxID=1871183 RepID=UPI002D4F29D0|nr:nitroreductase family protein [Kribbella sp.]HZX07652.1 nitroreductase family protein [Kribbella sp.]
MPVHPLLASRFSPLLFDSAQTVTDDDVDLLLEAARWAPSAGNSQPWAYFVARRDEPEHKRIVRHLARSSARWAPTAALLVVTMAHRYVEDTDWAYSDFADYDLGQSVAHLTLQAHAMGLACRQFRAFDLEALGTDLNPGPGWHIVSMIAVGTPAEDRPTARARRSTAELRTAPWDQGS